MQPTSYHNSVCTWLIDKVTCALSEVDIPPLFRIQWSPFVDSPRATFSPATPQSTIHLNRRRWVQNTDFYTSGMDLSRSRDHSFIILETKIFVVTLGPEQNPAIVSASSLNSTDYLQHWWNDKGFWASDTKVPSANRSETKTPLTTFTCEGHVWDSNFSRADSASPS